MRGWKSGAPRSQNQQEVDQMSVWCEVRNIYDLRGTAAGQTSDTEAPISKGWPQGCLPARSTAINTRGWLSAWETLNTLRNRGSVLALDLMPSFLKPCDLFQWAVFSTNTNKMWSWKRYFLHWDVSFLLKWTTIIFMITQMKYWRWTAAFFHSLC